MGLTFAVYPPGAQEIKAAKVERVMRGS